MTAAGRTYAASNSSARLQSHLHGLTVVTRDPRRFDRHLATVLPAEGRSGGRRDHAYVLFWNAELFGQLRPDAERALRPCPHRKPFSLPLGERGAGLERHVRDVGGRVRRVEAYRRVGECTLHVAELVNGRLTGRMRPQVRLEPALVHPGWELPCHAVSCRPVYQAGPRDVAREDR